MSTERSDAPPPMEVRHVRKGFAREAQFFSRRHSGDTIRAVDDVSLTVGAGEILGIVGESGAGKSTLGELIVGLQRPDSGTIAWHGKDTERLNRSDRRLFRREVQMVFQDPYGSLDAHFSTYQSVAEPVVIAGIHDRAERLQLVKRALTRSGLAPTDKMLRAHPHSLSGGQRQRVAIARAIVMEPKIVVADEPVSMLDASVRSGILNLFAHLRTELGLSIVYISHDLPSVHYLCDRVAIMYAGRLLEIGPATTIVAWARHPYTRELLAAVPGVELPEVADSREQSESTEVRLDACRYSGRCHFVEGDCTEGEPELASVSDDHQVRCLHPVAAPVWDR